MVYITDKSTGTVNYCSDVTLLVAVRISIERVP